MPQHGEQCPFCQLIANPDQLNLVGETENFYAWLEVNPRAKGHTMVVPKKHKENLLELSPGEWTEAMNLTREVVEKAKRGLGADGASVAVNIEEAGGQMLPHAYIIVFPRFQEEENAGTPTGAVFPHREELQSQLDEIRDSMASVEVDFGEEAVEPHPEGQKFKEDDNPLNQGIGSSLIGAGRQKKSAENKQAQEKNNQDKKEIQDDSSSKEKTGDSVDKDDSEPVFDDEDDEVEEVEFTGKSFEYR